MSSRRKPKRARVVAADRVCVHYQTEDQLVRWISSHSFYLKQMTWCVEEVTRYWRSTMRQHRGMYPYMVPDHIRFCMSWLSGIDCTNWSVRQICIWLNHRLGRGHKFETLMYMAWIHQSDPCPLVTTARRPWSKFNVPIVQGRVHLPPPKFISCVETVVPGTNTLVRSETDFKCSSGSEHDEDNTGL